MNLERIQVGSRRRRRYPPEETSRRRRRRRMGKQSRDRMQEAGMETGEEEEGMGIETEVGDAVTVTTAIPRVEG